MAQEAEAERPLEDYAEIYVDRYIPPAPELLLQEEGENKSEALAAYVLGLSKLKNDDIAGAIGAFERVLRVRPEVVTLAEKLAYLSARDGRPDEGLATLETSFEKNPDKVQAHIALSEYLATYYSENQEKGKRAFELAEEAVSMFPDDPNAYGHLVKMCIVQRKRDQAKSAMNAGLERENSNPYYWLEMADIAKRIWPLRDAKGQEPVLLNKIYQKALDRAGNSLEVRVEVANFYHASRQAEKARDLYKVIVEKAPDRLDVRERLAKVYGALGQMDKMTETLSAIVQIDPQNVQTHKVLAELYEQTNEVEKAIYHRRQALKIAKGSEQEYHALARLLLQEDQMDEAVRILERGAYLYPEDIDIPWMLSGISMQQEVFDKALEYFEEIIELASSTSPEILQKEFYFRYAIAAERSGDIDRATKILQKCLDFLEDEDLEDEETRQFASSVYNYLGYTWVENDMNIDQGGALIKAALDLDPNSGAIIDSLGWFYFKKGEFAKSLEQLLKAETLLEEPDSVIYDHIARAAWHTGDKAMAVTYMEKAVEHDDEEKAEYTERLEQFQKEDPPASTAPEPNVESAPEPEPKPQAEPRENAA